MTIIKSVTTSNFTKVSNILINTPMPFKAKDVLLHLLEKPANWKVIKAAICKQLQLSKYIVDKSLQWLRKQGYAVYQSSKRGGGQWFIFDTPQPKNAASPVIMPHLASPDRAITPSINKTNRDSNIKKTQQPATPVQPTVESIPKTVEVVVSSDELRFPPQLSEPQKKAAKHIIKKLKEPELAQDVLFALSYALTSGKIKCAPAYLQGLVTRANNGLFERTQPHTATKNPTAADRVAETRKRLSEAKNVKVDNASFFADLAKRYGAKASKAIPV